MTDHTNPSRVSNLCNVALVLCSVQIKHKRVNKVNQSRANQLLMTEWPRSGMSHDPQMVRLTQWPSQTHHADKRHSKDKHWRQHPSSASQKTLFNYSLLRCSICFSSRSQNSSFLFPCWMLYTRVIVRASLLWMPDTWGWPIKGEQLVNLSSCHEWRSSPDQFHREEQSQVSHVRMLNKYIRRPSSLNRGFHMT